MCIRIRGTVLVTIALLFSAIGLLSPSAASAHDSGDYRAGYERGYDNGYRVGYQEAVNGDEYSNHFPTGMTPTVLVFTMGSTLDTIEVIGTAAGDGTIIMGGEGAPRVSIFEDPAIETGRCGLFPQPMQRLLIPLQSLKAEES
jgi:hypothetical protein